MKPRFFRIFYPFIVLVLATHWLAATPAQSISLAGKWRFALDRNDVGIRQRWFESNLTERIKLPGALQNQGFGDEISTNTPWMGGIADRSWFTAPQYEKYRQAGNVKIPFWLQPDKYYGGAAWYQHDVEIPRDWNTQHVVLILERPHWESRVWLDDRELGSNQTLSVPHEYVLGFVAPGKHRLSVRVDNRLIVDIGYNSHSITDHTQGNWNGIVGSIRLSSRPPVWIDDLQVFPNVAQKTARVRVTVRNVTGKGIDGTISISVRGAKNVRTSPTLNFKTDKPETISELDVDFGPDAKTWDEFSPSLYGLKVEVRCESGGQHLENAKSVTVGLREIATQGTQFILNGRKTFIRGTLECCIFPLTGYPPTDVNSWKRIIRVCKAHGLNLIRFHSWCPPEAAFIAADELGFYYQVEAASWANQSTTIGDGKPVDAWVYAETQHILKEYGNHPSFLLMPYGNEPGGANCSEFLGAWVKHFKSLDNRRLFTSGSGWPQIAENQFHVTPDPRVQKWGAGLRSRINAQAPETCTDYRDYIGKRSVPVISHEIGQWCVYPNFEEIRKYRGHLKPKNFEIFRDSLREHHMLDQAHDFLLASGKLQTLCYKEDIEAALRTPGMGGFELLDLHDFPGQGTALVGVLDPFWETKGYVTAQEYSRFCNNTVPLARMKKRVFTTAEDFAADIELAHFGPSPISNAKSSWKIIRDDGQVFASGQFPARDLPVDNGIKLGSVDVGLSNAVVPRRYRLVVDVAGFENDWDTWIYPDAVSTKVPDEITVTHELDPVALRALDDGKKVLLLIPPARVKGDELGKIALGFSTIFWNTSWTRRQAPHTLGILCDPKTPALADFATDNHSNFQWWYLLSQSAPMILNDLPPQLRPVVQVIDDWSTNRRLGLIFEANVRRGKLLVCSIDLESNIGTNVVARQMRENILRYMSSSRFTPKITVGPESISALFSPSGNGLSSAQ